MADAIMISHMPVRGLLPNKIRFLVSATLICCFASMLSCRRQSPTGNFWLLRADRQVTGHSAFPLAVDLNQVGKYPLETKSGGGYFYDDVLEYRVWFHPENGADAWNGTHDYVVAFAQYEPALALSRQSRGAEPPLVLVRQREWIDEPEPGNYIVKNGERITEWDVAWLKEYKRGPDSIQAFLKHPRAAKGDPDAAEQ